MKITVEDLQVWEACTDGYRWFIETFCDKAEFGEFVAKCPKVAWVGWVCWNAGRDWKGSRHIPAIIEALVKTGDACYLCRAGLDWKDSRYTPAIAKALVKTGDAGWRDLAMQKWPDSRKKDLKRSKK